VVIVHADALSVLAPLPRGIEPHNEQHSHAAIKMRSPGMFLREQTLVE